MAAASFSGLLALLFMVASFVTYPVTAATVGDYRLRWVPVRGGCEGSIEECMGEGGTMEMEMSRRILATSQYISYRALQRNTVPCSQKGASYYNCQPGAAANPYTRGCAAITRCRTN
ncbi:rapid alkalinization factor-like [Neltuma alba]|uniref:rapid alkalinization factor-like n=1 Tax=Neltuma alba TaxID=207710 RepID=UPI0010A2FA68|nr:rapid alkalinization factor-like [Prosopis alba]